MERCAIDFLIMLCKTLFDYLFLVLARPGELERKGTRVNMVPIMQLEPGQKLPKAKSPNKKLEDLV